MIKLFYVKVAITGEGTPGTTGWLEVYCILYNVSEISILVFNVKISLPLFPMPP